MKNGLNDIRFWIILFFIIRLYGITNPPLEVAHNWRQTTVTMAARNFLETDSNILYPRIDIAGEKSGITGMEFPFLNYLIYLLSLIFGYAHWYGRLINLVVSSFGIFYFYKIIAKYFNPSIAFKAAFILILSVWFNYSRKIMPDTFSMSFVLAGIYYGLNYLDLKQSLKNLVLFFLCTLIGVLSKLPSAYLLIVFLFFLVDKNRIIQTRIVFFSLLALLMLFVAAYYFYWVPYLTETYGFSHFFMGKSISKGIVETFLHLDQVSEKFYQEALQMIGFAVFMSGVIIAIIKKDAKTLWVFGLCTFAFSVIIFKAGFVFYHHSYYIIPFAPLMAFMAAYAIEQITNTKLVWALLLLIAFENILNKWNDYQLKPDHAAMLNLEKDLDGFSNRSDLILINSHKVPTPMYFAHRKGWLNTNEAIGDTIYIKTLKEKGLKYIVILKKVFGTEMELTYSKVFECADYTIYKI